MTVAVVLFTSDLRLHDHPPLHAALKAADEVVPLFVRDPAVHAVGFDVPNRAAFLADCLADLETDLGHQVDLVLGAAVHLGVTALPAVAAGLAHG
ncbi:deoxyribodipyrimidine photo-lyase, partial [Streptomyces massasporeus]|uniref:deoxyribodipyrimidine photo-lyase n=1 Tax=Streptomyces massasporeus TaxID=67324 RepID=UPI003D9EC1A0